MASEHIMIVCPDTNVRLWSTRIRDAAMGGGKSAILQLAAAWARAGHRVTVAGAAVREGASEGVEVVELGHARGRYDVAIYVTGWTGHFGHPGVRLIEADRRLFWINGPIQVALPPGELPDWFIAPARFLARRAVDEWGYPPERVVIVPGEAVLRRRETSECAGRDRFRAIYASHPFKGLKVAIEVLGRFRDAFPDIRLDVYGSGRLLGDEADPQADAPLPLWVRFCGELPQCEIETRMTQYGLMLYLTEWLDGFSLATAEALAAGVVVAATNHGSNAEFIRHGWNGLLVRSNAGQPDLEQAEVLVRSYLREPEAFEGMRANAMASVPTWDEQAAEWREVWRSPARNR